MTNEQLNIMHVETDRIWSHIRSNGSALDSQIAGKESNLYIKRYKLHMDRTVVWIGQNMRT